MLVIQIMNHPFWWLESQIPIVDDSYRIMSPQTLCFESWIQHFCDSNHESSILVIWFTNSKCWWLKSWIPNIVIYLRRQQSRYRSRQFGIFFIIFFFSQSSKLTIQLLHHAPCISWQFGRHSHRWRHLWQDHICRTLRNIG